MATVDALRAECEELSKKRTRAAFATLIVLFVAVIAFTRAFRRIDEAEVRSHLIRIVTLAKATKTKPDLSYVFSRKYNELALAEESHTYADMPDDPAERSPEQQALAGASGELERLAASWFSLKVPMGGPDFDVDLRYWLAVLPLVLWGSSVYLVVIGAKLRVARRIAAAKISTDSPELDRFTLGGASAYARYPDVYMPRLFVALLIALLAYFVAASAPLWDLVSGTDTEILGGTWWPLKVLCVITYYVAALGWAARRRIERQGDAILGTEWRPFPALRLLQRARRTGRWIVGLASRAPRTLVTLGGAAIVISPFTMVATTCNNEPRSGMDLLLQRNEAEWFTSGGFAESMVPYLGRWFYAATLLLAFVALATVVSTIGNRGNWIRAARVLRPFAATVALFMLVETSFVFLVGFFPVSDLVRIAAVITPLVLWLRHRRTDRWRAIRARLEVCLLPAVFIAPFSLARCAAFGLTGLLLYFGGLVVLALPLLAPHEAEAVAPAAVAPAYSSP